MFSTSVKTRHKVLMREAEESKSELAPKLHELARRVHIIEWQTGLTPNLVEDPEPVTLKDKENP